MKKFIALVMVMVIFNISNMVYASPLIQDGKLGRHKEEVYTSIKKKLGITDENIKEAKEAGRTAFDLASELGVSENELRTYIIQDALKSLDGVIGKNIIPNFIVNKIRSKVETSIEKWDGYFD
jgi:predicted Holliday junction resolvase-like endonuclease